MKSVCVWQAASGIGSPYIGSYTSLRHPSAFKPVNPNVLNIRAKTPAQTTPTTPTEHKASVSSSEAPSSQPAAPPLMPRVARLTASGELLFLSFEY